MPVFLSTSVLGNAQSLVTVGGAGELMAWFFPHKDHHQHIQSCLPALYLGDGEQGFLNFLYDAPFAPTQNYIGDSLALQTTSEGFGLKISFCDVMPDDSPVLARQIRVENLTGERKNGGIYHLGHFKMGGQREGNALQFDFENRLIFQNHREAALCVGGDALDGHHFGKAGANWQSNARYALERGVLASNELEIGDVNFAAGFYFDLAPRESVQKTLFLALGERIETARANVEKAQSQGFDALLRARLEADSALLNGRRLRETGVLNDAFKRCLLTLPLLCGAEGVAVAAPEFDPEFIACGGYGYFWPRDGGEYLSGLLDAGYPEYAPRMFDWCARHQDPQGFWHQRYFLNGAPAPNWCLPPDKLQIDQVGAVGWAYGKWLDCAPPPQVPASHQAMLERAADYLISRLDENGVHRNAFDTWETFVGSFTYSNSAIYAHLLTAHRVSANARYLEAAQRVKNGVLRHFVRRAADENGEFSFLVRGLRENGTPDETVDSASLGAIEPFGLLDLNVPAELELALGTLRAVIQKLETDWQGGRAIRRFEGDSYVGGVPACVNTLWMARCCLILAEKTGDEVLLKRAHVFLSTVLKRATPTLLLPELMQGPEGQPYWAAPHGWAMSSFVSAVLKCDKLRP